MYKSNYIYIFTCVCVCLNIYIYMCVCQIKYILNSTILSHIIIVYVI